MSEYEEKITRVQDADHGALFDGDAFTAEREREILEAPPPPPIDDFEGKSALDQAIEIFDRAVYERQLLPDDNNWSQATGSLKYCVDQLLTRHLTSNQLWYLRTMIQDRFETVDQLIEEQAGEVRQDAMFRPLEHTWQEVKQQTVVQDGILLAVEYLDRAVLDDYLHPDNWSYITDYCNYLRDLLLSEGISYHVDPSFDVEGRVRSMINDRIEGFDYVFANQEQDILADQTFQITELAWQELKAAVVERHRRAIQREITHKLKHHDQIVIDQQLTPQDPNWSQARDVYRYFLRQVTGGIPYPDISDGLRLQISQRIPSVIKVLESKLDEAIYEPSFVEVTDSWRDLHNEIEVPPELSLLDQILIPGWLGPDDRQRPRGIELLTSYLEELKNGDLDSSYVPLISRMLGERIASIDRTMSAQLNEIVHHLKFQALEASWRCLKRLTVSVELGNRAKVRLLEITKKELLGDFEKAFAFDQSNVFKKVYEHEYGTLGGEPYTVLMCDYEFTRHPADIELLQHLSELAAAAHAPMISSAHPSLFDLESFAELDRPRDLSRTFETTQMAKWRSFRSRDASRYVALTLPRVQVRAPYGPDSQQGSQEISFVEDVEGTDSSKYLWGLSCWSLIERIIIAFNMHGWCAWIRGMESGGRVDNLPQQSFKGDGGGSALRPPVEIQISDTREKELGELGFISLSYARNTPYAVFYSASTVNLPRKYNNIDATTNSRLSSMLQYILTASRFAHYVKSIMRDKVGGFETREAVQRFLNEWISQYITQDENASMEIKARYPLREARIDVVENPGQPGKLSAIIYIQPHFQLEELTSSIRLMAHLPQPAG